MRQSVDDLAKELEQLREPVAAAFAEQTWASTRGQLLALGRQRDAELFGRPQRLPEK
jgi:hypothetical protein